MTVTIEMPKLSDTMSVGTVVKWHKNIGDKVQNGDTLAEIETDKATMELENFEDGILLKILVSEGQEAPIGSPLAIVGEEGESIDDETINAPNTEKHLETKSLSLSEDETFSDQKQQEIKDDISVVKETAQLPQDTSTKDLVEENSFSISSDRILISPLAKKIALEKNLDISKITGSGPSGRIVKRDLQETDVSKVEVFQKTKNTDISLLNTRKSHGLLVAKTIPLSGMRSVIASRLSESKSTIPHFYLQKEINAKPLLETRIALNKKESKIAELTNAEFNKISVNDLILKACAESIKWHPEINTSWGKEEIIFHESVELSFGVAVDGGLVTPVINNADSLSLSEISLKAKSLIGEARDKKLSPDAMTGSTFTVTNLGMYGIDFFSGIINPPNAAILAVGSSVEKPVVDNNGKIVVGQTLTLGLSCDHRLVDGAVGASFLATLANNLENPACMLV